MPTFATPAPIDLAIDLAVGGVEVIASDRADTVVTVSPSNPGKDADVRAAQETAVEFDGQRLTVKGPKPRIAVFGPNASIEVKAEVPIGSRLTADVSVGGLRSAGRLGATRVKGSMGAVMVDSAGDVWVHTSHGSATVGTADGGLEVSTDHGQVRVGSVSGDAVLKSSHGSILVGEVGGDVEAKLSYGDLDIDHARGSVNAKTSMGSIRLQEVSNGSIDVESAMGEIAIGVRRDTPAWLDLASKTGRVRNELDASSAPQPGESSVSVRARTKLGTITISRAD